MRNIKEFGALIAIKRKQKGMTQEDFAGKLGITPQAVSKWENGIGYPDVTLFPAIANTLEISIETLFVDEKERSRPQQFPSTSDGLPFICSIGGNACYSNKETASIDKENGIVYFTDGSEADFRTQSAVNKGIGEIRFREADEEPPIEIGTATSFYEETEPYHSLAISLSYSCDAKIIKTDGKAPRVEANGSAKFISLIRLEQKDGKLSITVKSIGNYNADSAKNTLTIYTPFEKGNSLALTINGASDVDVGVDFENAGLIVNGSGNINGKFSCDTLSAKINGSGDIGVIAAKEYAGLLINGSGDITLGSAGNTVIAINGSGGITVRKLYAEKLSAKVNGSGDITAAGEAKEFLCKIIGSSDIHGDALVVGDATIDLLGSSEVSLAQIKGTSREKLSKNAILSVRKRGI